jgi:hypothetical protein
MKLALPLLLLSTIVALTLGKRDDTTDIDVRDWIKTGDIDDDLAQELNEDIDDCVRETHTHGMFYHCVDDHTHYHDELTSKQKREIRQGADDSHVHQHGGHGSRKLRGI